MNERCLVYGKITSDEGDLTMWCMHLLSSIRVDDGASEEKEQELGADVSSQHCLIFR